MNAKNVLSTHGSQVTTHMHVILNVTFYIYERINLSGLFDFEFIFTG